MNGLPGGRLVDLLLEAGHPVRPASRLGWLSRAISVPGID
jgi:hypothetical protein